MALSNIIDIQKTIELQADIESSRIQGGDKMIDWYLDRVPKLHGRSWKVARRLARLENMRRAKDVMLNDPAFQGVKRSSCQWPVTALFTGDFMEGF